MDIQSTMDSQPLNLTADVDLNLVGDEDDDDAAKDKKLKQDNDNDNDSGQMGPPANYDDDSSKAVPVPVCMAITKVLKNPMILTKILSKVEDTTDLVNFRLVNLEWRDLSTDILLKKRSLEVRLQRVTRDNNNPHSQPPTSTPTPTPTQSQRFALAWSKRHSLSELTLLLNPQTRFCCVCFSFHGDLNSEDAQDFLDKHGKNIKGLRLSGKSRLEFLRKILVKQVTNLESLSLNFREPQEPQAAEEEGVLFPGNENDNENPPNLRALTHLHLDEGHSDSLVREIVEAAPNLQECTGVWSRDQIQFLLPRIHILKKLVFSPEVDGDNVDLDLNFWESLTENQNLQVKTLSVDFSEMYFLREQGNDVDDDDDDEGVDEEGEGEEMAGKIERIASKFLESNQLTLRKLKFFAPLDIDIHIKWPKLEGVEKVLLDGIPPRWNARGQTGTGAGAGAGAGGMRFPTLDISKHFPNLKNLTVNSIDIEKSKNIFNGQVLTLKSLSILKQPELFDRCHETFPKLSHLSLNHIQDGLFPRIATKIWKLEQLKCLELSFLPCDQDELDACFTGMEKKTCASLDKCGNDQPPDAEIEKLRVNPSILNLKGLKTLDLSEERRQESPFETEDGGTKSCGPSFVSYLYAFYQMPKLEIID